jgi:hypothetical protein
MTALTTDRQTCDLISLLSKGGGNRSRFAAAGVSDAIMVALRTFVVQPDLVEKDLREFSARKVGARTWCLVSFLAYGAVHGGEPLVRTPVS